MNLKTYLKVVMLLLTPMIAEIFHKSSSDCHWQYGDTCSPLLHTLLDAGLMQSNQYRCYGKNDAISHQNSHSHAILMKCVKQMVQRTELSLLLQYIVWCLIPIENKDVVTVFNNIWFNCSEILQGHIMLDCARTPFTDMVFLRSGSG